jgi:DNA replication protein DnaC
MNSIAADIDKLLHSVELREDEYRDDATGLVFCSRCMTPRQKRLELGGSIYTPRCMCDCQSADYEQRETLRRRQEFLDMVARNRSIGLPEPGLRKHTFANDLGYNHTAMSKAKKYVDNWDQMYQKSMGLLLWGDVGTGKSYIAGCIANELLERGVSVLMTNFARLLNRMTDLNSGDRNAYVDSFNAYQLLIIDDLGIERNSEFAREQVFHIIDSRYRSQKPMIVTTNIPLPEMREVKDMSRARVFNRVLERCVPICVDECDIRAENASENLALAKELFAEDAQ